MPPKGFEDLAQGAFKVIKKTMGTNKLVLYKPKVGGSFPLKGIFDDRAQEVDPDTERTVSSNVFTLGIQLTDLPSLPVKGDIVLIDTQDYRVIDALEDGVPGVSTVLILHRIDP